MAERRPDPPRRLRFREDDFNAPPAPDDMLGEVVWELRQRHYRRALRAWTAAAVVCAVAAVAILWWWTLWPAVAAAVSLVAAWVVGRVGRP